jgi:hypothetical protein
MFTRFFRAALITSTAILGAARGLAADAEPVRGPFWSGTVMRNKGEMAAAKGLAVILGADKRAYVVYDLDTMRVASSWTGDFLEFGDTLTKIAWPPPPTMKGNVAFDSGNGPGWADPGGSFADPRDHVQGPLPKSWSHYQGLYVNGDRVILKYTVGNAQVLESPSIAGGADKPVFVRTFEFESSPTRAEVLLASGAEGAVSADLPGSGGHVSVPLSNGRHINVWAAKAPAGSRIEARDGRVVLKLGKVHVHQAFHIFISPAEGAADVVAALPGDLRPLLKGGPAHFPATVPTVGKLGTEDGPYVVDTITEPFPNPYNARTFFGGFDFLPDGRAVICTFHGDVWVVSGVNDKLDHLEWRRFATGLFQPLGVKVQKGQIYVAGRDQITRLQDLNGDGEADYYENFNNDTVVTPNYHEFVLDLHTDSKGNFYFAKGAPWEPNVTSPHQGTLLKVSPDGSKLEIVATGLRAPNGMTVGPDDTILISDNEGHWMPSSKLNLVKPGAFLGMTPAAHKQLTLRYKDGREITLDPSDPDARKKYGLKGWDGEMPLPTKYDEPIVWLPKRWDNSSGGQTYVTSDKWGPWKGAPLFTSYGTCLLFGVLWDEVDGVTQASMAPFNLTFASGVMRARFSDHDGQLYLCGLRGWQNRASRDGGFYRVRYTGKPVRMVTKAHVAQNGIELAFSTPLDPKAATDTGRYAVELWNYHYAGSYGSKEWSVKNPSKDAHDKLEVKSASLSADGRRLFLEVPGLQIADQYGVKYDLTSSDGVEMRSEVIGTIHKLGAPMGALR